MVLARRDTGPVPDRRAGRATRRILPLAVAALAPAFLCARPARALEFPPATGVGVFETRDSDDKRLSVSAGYAFGSDSNYRLEPADKERDANFYETTAGLVLNGGNALWDMQLSYKARQDRYTDTDENFFRDNQAALTVGKYTEKLQFGLRAKYAALEDPVVIEDLDRSFARTQVAYAPQIAFGSGKTEFGIGYTVSTMRYDELTYLDHDQEALEIEGRWWRAETNQIFVHCDLGSVNYLGDDHPDFDYTRFYGGWRLDVPERLGLDIGVGFQQLSDFDKFPTLSSEGLFAMARAGLVGSGGTSRLEFAFGMSDEQSATSAYKSVSTVEVRYRRQANRRINWAVAARREAADFDVPITNLVSSLSRMMADAEINVDVGSLSGAHGRIFASVEYQSRSGNLAAYEYARLRLLGGLGIVF